MQSLPLTIEVEGVQNKGALATAVHNLRARTARLHENREGPVGPLEIAVGETETLSTEEMQKVVYESSRVLNFNALSPNIAAAMRGTLSFSEKTVRSGAVEPHAGEFTAWDRTTTVLPLAFRTAFGNIHLHREEGVRLCETSEDLAKFIVVGCMIFMRMALLFYPMIRKSNLQIIRIDANLVTPLRRFTSLFTDHNIFGMANETLGCSNFIPFFEAESAEGGPPRLMAIKTTHCSYAGTYEQAVPRIPDDFLNSYGPSYGWVMMTLPQAASLLGPQHNHLYSRAAFQVLENNIPPMFADNLRTGEVQIGNPCDIKVHLCPLEECKPGFNGIDPDQKVAVLIHVANAPATMPFFELWDGSATHQVIGTPGVMNNDGTVN